jgi:O-antigen ligase
MALDHPLFGIGPDNFRLMYGDYLGSTNWNTGVHANNMYLEWLADSGVVGLVTFLLASLMLARVAWRMLKQHLHDPLWVWRLALIGSLTAWYLHGFVDYFFEFTPASILFWILVGLSISSVPQTNRG